MPKLAKASHVLPDVKDGQRLVGNVDRWFPSRTALTMRILANWEEAMARHGHAGKMDLGALVKFLAESTMSAPSHYAFVRRGKVMCFYADASVALEAGSRSFPDHEFSVIDVQAQKVVLPH